MTTKVKNKEDRYNVKVNEEGDIHELSEEEYMEICASGKDPKTGKFVKGNRIAELQKHKRNARERMAGNFRKGEEIEVLKALLKSKNDNVRLNAAKLILEYKHGKPTQIVETENVNHNKPNDVPDEVQDLLDSIGE